MTDRLHQLVRDLQRPDLYQHPVTRFDMIETHISVILLTGHYAYKFKKPVNFGFLDFSSLAKRRHCCEQEVRLNRRLAPELYIDVVPISAGPEIGCGGQVIEYAVRMREFDQSMQFDRMLDEDRLKGEHIDALARCIAEFHIGASQAGPQTSYGQPDTVRQPVEENFRQVLACTQDTHDHDLLAPLQSWTQRSFTELRSSLQARRNDGFIRECHGDLHLRNIALVDEQPLAFDCIEFNDSLRWIDTISEVAFMVMDLDHRNRPALASRFLNVWLEQTGDYAGVSLLRYYLLYRAMVRAKVDCLRLHQSDIGTAEKDTVRKDYRAYLDLGRRYIRPARGMLLLMHGLSGSGKTTVSRFLLENLPAIRIRSDIERKRLHGLAADARTASDIDQGIYSRGAGERTYRRLASLTDTLLNAGYSVIVDAAFLQPSLLVPFIDLARKYDTRCRIIDCRAPEAELRKRISARQQAGHDASEAGIRVLEHQLQNYQPLPAEIAGAEIHATGSDESALDELLNQLRTSATGAL